MALRWGSRRWSSAKSNGIEIWKRLKRFPPKLVNRYLCNFKKSRAEVLAKNYGRSVLSHPLIVEAIEDLFVPVLVYNNKSSDSATLKKFGEPSWNNPVVRFLNSNEKDVIARQSGVYTVGPMATRMVAALKASKREVPAYLNDLVASNAKLEPATFAMYCYWTGEAKLGAIDGVMSTTAGYAGGLEVVQLTYDPKKVDYAKLVKTAQSFECATKVFTHTDAQQKTAKALVGSRAVEFPW